MLVPATRTKDFRRTTLRPRHRPIVRALAEAFFSPDGQVAASRLDSFIDEVDSFISPTSKTLRFGLLMLLEILRWSPLLYLRFRAFDDLTLEERLVHLERLEKSRFGRLAMVVVAYKTIMTMLFYENEDELRALGYPGPARQRWRRALPMEQRA
jgi:hypothetical protein